MYGERVGALTLVTNSAEAAQRALSQVRISIRCNYSNPPTHGGALVAAVLFSWLVTGLNIPWIAPVSHDSPTLLPVRVIAALIWAAGAYAVRRAMGR